MPCGEWSPEVKCPFAPAVVASPECADCIHCEDMRDSLERTDRRLARIEDALCEIKKCLGGVYLAAGQEPPDW